MDDQVDISIDEIRLWTVSALKDFLRSRNLKVSGRKEELVALVYAAKIMPAFAPPATSSAEAAAEKKEEYEDLLKTPNGSLPDPKSLTNWISEEKGVQKWPPTMAFDIGNYLSSIDNIDLRTRLMADYKDQKAYSYFASGWMGEVEYNDISPESAYCVLRADCTPSQRVRDIPWKVWVTIEKKSGKIHSAFCTCFAGFSSTCNHVAALLFKVDFAWRHGLNNLACTSMACEWSAFSGRRAVEPKRISELMWSKPQFSKQGSSKDSEGINPKARQLFSPLGARSTSNPTSVTTLTQALFPHFEDAAVFQCINIQPSTTVQQSHADIYTDVNVHHEEVAVAKSVPLPLPLLASNAGSLQEFIAMLPSYSVDEVRDLEEATRGQADNEEWMKHRRGRVTGSVAHAVMTKQRSKDKKGEEVNTASLVKRILGYEGVDSSLPALKYGREMEEEARSAYVREHKIGHRHFEVKDCGLFVAGDKVFLGASPDGIIKCSCCDTGVLEIKCPHSIAHTKPSKDNLMYLSSGDGVGVLELKKSHQYYSQVQHQMGVTGIRWCHFFVYTRQGHVTIKVNFDEDRWNELVDKSTRFFHECISKEMMDKELFEQMGGH